MQLIMLCREKDFKYFGHERVFSELVADMKDLEENGVALSDQSVVKGSLYCIAGGNLGSHSIGGFTENFSQSKYAGIVCTVERYSAAVNQLRTKDATEIEGIKFNSIFNSLNNFKVCQLDLLSCLGHDIFDGVLSYDVDLYNKYFVKKKWFTYPILNRRISQFKYNGSDSFSKPCKVNSRGLKLTGQVIKNWNLRLLPVILGNKVLDPADEVWQLILQLKDMDLESRKAAFPEVGPKAKHHYLRHYPGPILKFGPLIRLWTMRFESKHSYFKRCAKHLNNFKNLCRTLSERHQLFQAY